MEGRTDTAGFPNATVESTNIRQEQTYNIAQAL